MYPAPTALMAPPMMSPPPAAGGFSPPAMQGPTPDPMMGMPMMQGPPGMDSFSAQQAGLPPMPEADMAMLSQILGGAGQPGMASQGMAPQALGMPGQMPTPNLQVIPTGNGLPPMVLENPGAMPGAMGAPGGIPDMSSMRPPSFLSVLTSPTGLLSLGLLGVGGFFGIRALMNRGKAIGEGALERLMNGKEELFNNIKSELGNPEALTGLEQKTMAQVEDVIAQNSAAINGMDDSKQAADHLVERTNALFEHARGLSADDTLSQKVVSAFDNALDKLKKRLSGEEAAQAAE